MRHRQHLGASREPRQALTHRVGDGAANAGVDLVEDQSRRSAALRQSHLDREQEPGKLAARGHLHEGARAGARIGAHEEFRSVVPARRNERVIALKVDAELGPFELERRQFRADRRHEFARARLAPGAERRP